MDNCEESMGDEKEVVLDSEDEEICRTKVASIANNRAKRRVNRSAICLRKRHLTSVCGADTLEGNKGSSIPLKRRDGGKYPPQLLPRKEEFERLNYINSQEPDELSQANVLEFVDHFLSLSNVEMIPGIDPRKTVREKSPPISRAKGPQSLAKKIQLRLGEKTSTFEWVDSDKHKKGGEFFGKRTETSLGNHEKASNLDDKKDISLSYERVEKEEFVNPHDLATCSSHSDSKFVVCSPKETCKLEQLSKMKIDNSTVKELEVGLDEDLSGQEMEASANGRDTLDMFDIGFNTQIAAEAMEALSYAPPATCSSGDSYRGQQNDLEDSPRDIKRKKVHLQHYSLQKSVFPNLVNIPRKPRRGKGSAIISSKGTSSESQKQYKNVGLDPNLAITTREKCGDLLVQRHLNCRNIDIANEIPGRRSPKVLRKRKAGISVDTNDIKEFANNSTSSILINHNSEGKGHSKGESLSSSLVAHPTRPWSIGSLKRTTNDVVEGGILTYKRKRSALLSARGKCSKFCSSASGDGRNSKLSQQEQTDSEFSARVSYSKVDAWSYPRRKRTCRNIQSLPNGASNLPTPTARADGKESNSYSHERQKGFEGRAETSCSDSNVKRKPQLLVYSRQFLHSSEKISEGSLLKQNFDDAHRVKVHAQSGKSDSPDFILYSDETETMKVGDSAGMKIVQTVSECTATVNITEGINVASGNYMCYEYHKKPCKKNVPKSSLLKELIRLGVPESMPDLTWKDLRRRRHTTNVRVLFSQHLDDNVIKQQKRILARLGISIASCSTDATHFITDKFARTRNMLESIAQGKPVVTHLWLENCGQANCLIDEKNYILRDAKKEKEICFSMPLSLARASRHPLLKGLRVFITPNIKPDQEMITSMVKAVHGQAVDEIQVSAVKDEQMLDNLLILSCEEDYPICEPFLKRGAAVYNSELLLNGIVIQKLEHERHQLFLDHVKRNGSS